MKPILVIGSDHAGYRMKQFIIKNLKEKGYLVEDKGPFNEDSVDAGIYAVAVGEDVAAHPAEKKGILICGTGIGMSMMANKVKGIRASLVSDLFSAEMTRAHNDANVLCMGARVVAEPIAWEFTRVWLTTKHLGGKYSVRVQHMMDYETKREEK
ncbi:ribose 5-phosphate isomerase B [Sporomusaceae bacterium BoRhaA]|uniref:ribose 5-phosphate isomerase B n=1 Tax=Pelorhabdus rhamnosifermentans TaxID=2772457 RepID=UPI001FEAEE78|nr:ribose 5-phosphate isomerase B [Pelorhabdus rhamnosifermentans]MBU2701319.1 ribose 5-phosphate isomerase B [Pelorhabdus rhamnosifermentans]